MRGINFKVKNSTPKIIYKILEGIEFEKFLWDISEAEIYNNNEFNESIFEDEYIDGKTFLKKICNENYWVYFVNIKAYPPNSTPEGIKNYDDFLKSKCQLVLLCYDMRYYEIFSKDTFYIELIKNNCIKNKFDDIEYTTDENDGRTRFSVG